MSGVFVNVLIVVLVGVTATFSILALFAVAGKIIHEVIDAFQRSTLAGIGLLVLTVTALFAVIFLIREATPYVMDFYHQTFG